MSSRGVTGALVAARLGQRRGEADRQKMAEQEQSDALKMALAEALLRQREAQAGASDALATKRMTPQAARPVRIDPLSEQGLEAGIKRDRERAISQAKARAMYRPNKQNPSRSRPSGGTTHGQPKKAGGVGSPETSRRERYFNTVADRAVAGSKGDASAAGAHIIQNPETKDIFGLGMDQSHLNAAVERAKQKKAAAGKKPSRFGAPQPMPEVDALKAKDPGGSVVIGGEDDIIRRAIERIRAGQGTLEQALAAFPPEYHDALRRAAQGAP
jgi:hypothetical protein